MRDKRPEQNRYKSRGGDRGGGPVGQLRPISRWARIMRSMAMSRFKVRDNRTEHPKLSRH